MGVGCQMTRFALEARSRADRFGLTRSSIIITSTHLSIIIATTPFARFVSSMYFVKLTVPARNKRAQYFRARMISPLREGRGIALITSQWAS